MKHAAEILRTEQKHMNEQIAKAIQHFEEKTGLSVKTFHVYSNKSIDGAAQVSHVESEVHL